MSLPVTLMQVVVPRPEERAGGGDVSEHLNAGIETMGFTWLLIFGGFALLAVGVSAVWQRRRAGVLHAPVAWVAWRLMGSLGLTLAQRWLLVRVARRAGLSSPIPLLVDPDTLVHHARALNRPQALVDARALATRLHPPDDALLGVA